MTINEFIRNAAITDLSVEEYINASERLRYKLVPLLHFVLGTLKEIGEVAELLNDAIFEGKTIDNEKLVLETGDVSWYYFLFLNEVASITGTPVEKILELNTEKLKEKYPEKYEVLKAKELSSSPDAVVYEYDPFSE